MKSRMYFLAKGINLPIRCAAHLGVQSHAGILMRPMDSQIWCSSMRGAPTSMKCLKRFMSIVDFHKMIASRTITNGRHQIFCERTAV